MELDDWLELDDDCVALDCEATLESDLIPVADEVVAEPPAVRLPWNVSGEPAEKSVHLHTSPLPQARGLSVSLKALTF